MANGMRLDYFMNVVGKVLESQELKDMLGEPLDQHVGVVVKDSHLYFYAMTPHGEGKKEYTPEQQKKVQEITNRIISTNFAGSSNLPGVR